jgi:hypothetical protein
MVMEGTINDCKRLHDSRAGRVRGREQRAVLPGIESRERAGREALSEDGRQAMKDYTICMVCMGGFIFLISMAFDHSVDINVNLKIDLKLNPTASTNMTSRTAEGGTR